MKYRFPFLVPMWCVVGSNVTSTACCNLKITRTMRAWRTDFSNLAAGESTGPGPVPRAFKSTGRKSDVATAGMMYNRPPVAPQSLRPFTCHPIDWSRPKILSIPTIESCSNPDLGYSQQPARPPLWKLRRLLSLLDINVWHYASRKISRRAKIGRLLYHVAARLEVNDFFFPSTEEIDWTKNGRSPTQYPALFNR